MKDKVFELSGDRYTVIDALKSGGQGSIWKVKRSSDGVIVALKTVLTHRMKANHPEYLPQEAIDTNKKRIQSEISFLESLSDAEQSFIVPCLDSGFINDAKFGSLPAWVMPLYAKTLEYKMPPYPEGETAPSVEVCLKWIEQVTIALKATHAHHLDDDNVFVHRDIKASNMMLTGQDDIRLIDFGIVHETQVNRDTGTHSYSTESGAPEQFLARKIEAGKSLYAIGSYSDLYGLGTVIYRLFTGASTTEAQQQLKSEETKRQHLRTLDDDNTGLLGTIGGLSASEYKLLCYEIKQRIRDSFSGFDENLTDKDATIISTTPTDDLPDSEVIAISIADFVRDLLHAEFKKRPDAINTLAWCKMLRKALSPKLTKLSLSVDNASLSLNKAIKLSVIAEGRGLPAHSDWMTLTRDGKPLHRALVAMTQSQHQFGFIVDSKAEWEATLDASEKAESFSVMVEAKVNGSLISDELSIQIKDSADALWNAGKQQQALCVDLRDDWLDKLQSECVTLEQATKYSELLKSLRDCHPDKDAIIDFRMRLFREEFGHSKKPLNNILSKVFGIGVLLFLLTGLGTAWYWYQSHDSIETVEQEKLKQLEADLNSSLSGARFRAWSELIQLLEKKSNNNFKLKEIYDKFRQSTFDLTQIDNQVQQKKAIPRLHLLANNGDKKATLLLADAYRQGKGVELNWGKTWDWYQKMNAVNEIKKFEQLANKILHDRHSPQEQRNLAYQVAEQAAKHESAGDAAQKWMEYRYLKGDGVKKDKQKAKYWKMLYEGKTIQD